MYVCQTNYVIKYVGPFYFILFYLKKQTFFWVDLERSLLILPAGGWDSTVRLNSQTMTHTPL